MVICKTAHRLSYFVILGGFKWFSYGSDENINVYGSNAPPDYDLSKVSASVAIFYSKDDDDIAYLVNIFYSIMLNTIYIFFIFRT